MVVNPFLPSVYTSSTPTKVQSTSIFRTQEREVSDKIRFVFEAPAPKQQEPVYAAYSVVNESTDAFAVLLQGQEQKLISQNNSAAVKSPYENASEAYGKAEDVARYARSQNFDLGTL